MNGQLNAATAENAVLRKRIEAHQARIDELEAQPVRRKGCLDCEIKQRRIEELEAQLRLLERLEPERKPDFDVRWSDHNKGQRS